MDGLVQPEVRAYNIAIAVEAAKAGFDEVQFDYVRFPDSNTKLSFHGPTDEAGRVKAITAFLAQAHAALVPYNVFQAADIFGYVGWNLNDTGIGQQLQDIVDTVDYVCQCFIPRASRREFPVTRIPWRPIRTSDDTVRLTIDNSIRRTHANPRSSDRGSKPSATMLSAAKCLGLSRWQTNSCGKRTRAATDGFSGIRTIATPTWAYERTNGRQRSKNIAWALGHAAHKFFT